MTVLVMTSKSIACVAGCSIKTVNKHVNTMFPDKMKGKGVKRWFTKEESTMLMSVLPKRNMVEKAQKVLPEGKNVPSIDNAVLFEFMEKSQARQEDFMLKMFEMMKANSSPAILQESKLVNYEPLCLPLPEVPTVTPRQEISQIVRGYVQSKKMAVTYSDAWKRLLREFRDRHGVDLIVRAKNRGCKSLDYAESEGMIMQVLALANVLFVEV